MDKVVTSGLFARPAQLGRWQTATPLATRAQHYISDASAFCHESLDCGLCQSPNNPMQRAGTHKVHGRGRVSVAY